VDASAPPAAARQDGEPLADTPVLPLPELPELPIVSPTATAATAAVEAAVQDVVEEVDEVAASVDRALPVAVPPVELP
jgi:hypothetical protein